ncbi:MAG: hypothetical protein KME19_02975 [Microcoleus vaginatus WJT46-NPBG5]|jgi:hypothetical protein|nr:hypothetical protein [Microcoleus vaginatus WJT46-NPBG5]
MLSRSNLACFFFHHTGEMSLSGFGLLWQRDLAAKEGESERWAGGDGSRTVFVYSNCSVVANLGLIGELIMPVFLVAYNRLCY